EEVPGCEGIIRHPESPQVEGRLFGHLVAGDEPRHEVQATSLLEGSHDVERHGVLRALQAQAVRLELEGMPDDPCHQIPGDDEVASRIGVRVGHRAVTPDPVVRTHFPPKASGWWQQVTVTAADVAFDASVLHLDLRVEVQESVGDLDLCGPG